MFLSTGNNFLVYLLFTPQRWYFHFWKKWIKLKKSESIIFIEEVKYYRSWTIFYHFNKRLQISCHLPNFPLSLPFCLLVISSLPPWKVIFSLLCLYLRQVKLEKWTYHFYWNEKSIIFIVAKQKFTIIQQAPSN